MCIPVDSLLWALVARIRDEGYLVTAQDVRALLGSGCTPARFREVAARVAGAADAAAFAHALRVLDSCAAREGSRTRSW